MNDLETTEAWLETPDGEKLSLGGNCQIGRSPSNSIVVSDQKVSRRHAVIHRQDVDAYLLVDLGSANGSYINEMRISLPVRLRDGNVINIGDYCLTFRQVAADELNRESLIHASMTVIDVKTVSCWMLLGDIIGSTKLALEHPGPAWASKVGSWAGECRQIIELHGGVINKYLGDGFLAIWPAQSQSVEHIAGAVKRLKNLQSNSALPFRLALHVGEVVSGGGPSLGEDNLSGFDLVLLFRMEKMCSSLGTRFLLSDPAFKQLGAHLDLKSAGHHEVIGYIDSEPREFFCPVDE